MNAGQLIREINRTLKEHELSRNTPVWLLGNPEGNYSSVAKVGVMDMQGKKVLVINDVDGE